MLRKGLGALMLPALAWASAAQASPMPASASAPGMDTIALATSIVAGVALVAWAISVGRARTARAKAKTTIARIAATAREVLGAGSSGAAEGLGQRALEEAMKRPLDKRIADAKERCDRCVKELVSLSQTQTQTMRALAALGLVDPKNTGVAAQAENWSKIVDAAKRFAGEQRPRLLDAMQTAHGSRQADQALFSGSGDQVQAIGWLKQNGFAGDDTAARAVLVEMVNHSNHLGMTDMNARLLRLAEECRRAHAELAILNALEAG